MQYDMEPQWRPGTKHQFAIALSRSHGHTSRGATVDDSFPADSTTKRTYRGPQGPVLDGVALECTRAKGMATNALFKQMCPGDPEYGSWVKSLKPQEIIGNTSRANELEEGPQDTAGEATTTVYTSIPSQAHLLIQESTPHLLKSATWTDDFSPLLSNTGYCLKAVEMSA